MSQFLILSGFFFLLSELPNSFLEPDEGGKVRGESDGPSFEKVQELLTPVGSMSQEKKEVGCT